MDRRYWLDLFTGKTWDEFIENGASVSGFRARRRKMAEKIQPGDYLICYLTGISRFIAILEVKSKCYFDETPVFKDEAFPYRFKVASALMLEPSTAVPVLDLKDKLSIFKNLKSKNAWTGFFRGSPAEFEKTDGEAIVMAISDASKKPIKRNFDEKKYRRKAKVYELKEGVVTVPEEEQDSDAVEHESEPVEKVSHSEIQWLLLKLGSDMGLDVWVARNDRNREFQGKFFKDLPKIKNELPRQFDEATNRTIELIDVLWLQGDAIVAAFEIEHSTSIYSGLLRMSDLVTMQPNIRMNLYLVAPDERREKVFEEINRPTFAKLKTALPKICKFIPYSELKKEVEQIGRRVQYLKPEFIEEFAENCEPDEA